MEHHLHLTGRRIFSNQVYVTFILASLVVHWRFLATIFLVHNESIVAEYGVTKDIYLKNLLFDYHDPWVSLFLIFLPFFITWFVLYWIQPKLLPYLLKKHKQYEIEKERIEISGERILAEERIKKASTEIREAEMTTKVLHAQAEIIEADPSIKWERSYQKFKNSLYFDQTSQLIEQFYLGNKEINNGGLGSYLDSIGIVSLVEKNPNKILDITDKGKYFIRRMNEGDK